ncbi:sterile alpha motif domain-containing protein 1-like [Rhea pennata]|uniref:sterile alpha motif domain-containing protein 1-like n=1 Tax=Rhea pennata TaxID=8795 RepID=UPI002E2720DA
MPADTDQGGSSRRRFRLIAPGEPPPPAPAPPPRRLFVPAAQASGETSLRVLSAGPAGRERSRSRPPPAGDVPGALPPLRRLGRGENTLPSPPPGGLFPRPPAAPEKRERPTLAFAPGKRQLPEPLQGELPEAGGKRRLFSKGALSFPRNVDQSIFKGCSAPTRYDLKPASVCHCTRVYLLGPGLLYPLESSKIVSVEGAAGGKENPAVAGGLRAGGSELRHPRARDRRGNLLEEASRRQPRKNKGGDPGMQNEFRLELRFLLALAPRMCEPPSGTFSFCRAA